MKVCIARNAEARTNAAIARIANALESEVEDITLLTRNRYVTEYGKINELKYKTSKKDISNYEIKIKSKTGKGYRNLFQLFLFQFLAFKWFVKNRKKYDIIHAFDLDIGLPALLIAKIIKKKYVYHIADFYADSRSGFPTFMRKAIKQLEYLVIKRAEVTIICTEEREEQIQGSKPKKLVVVHNTPISGENKLNSFSHELKDKEIDKYRITFTYVGGLTKNRFIESIINVIKKYPQVQLNLAGMGKIAEFVEKSSKEYQNINYFGMISYNDALSLYSTTDFMFAIYDPKVPNYRYSAPNKVYEAMMLGKPIIVSKGSGIDQMVMKNKIGLTIDFSEESFEKTLKLILDTSNLSKTLAENSRKAYKNYSWDEMKHRIIEVYQNIQ